MENNGKLLICQDCLKLGKKQILGSVDMNGAIHIARFHNGETVIQSVSMMIVCTCGFGTAVYTTSGAQTIPYMPREEKGAETYERSN